MRRRAATTLVVLLVSGVLVACGGGDGSTEPPLPMGRSVRVIAGAGVADTVDARPVQALVVEVRDRYGRPMPEAVVRFEAQPSTAPGREFDRAILVCAVSATSCGVEPWPFPGPTGAVAVDTTDATGRALASVRLGIVVGSAEVKVLVPEIGVATTATFTVQPGAAHTVRLSDEAFDVNVGGSVTATAIVADRYGNARPDRPTFAVSGPPGAAVDATTGVVTVTDMGTFTLTASSGAAMATAIVSARPPGRLLVWSPAYGAVRLVDTDGANLREIMRGVASDHGVFPRLDPSRTRVVLHAGAPGVGGEPRRIVAVDTAGTNEVELVPSGVNYVQYARPLADGTTMYLAASRDTTRVWRATADGSIAEVGRIPSFRNVYGSADISPDGARVAYVATAADGYSDAGLHVLDISTGHVRMVAATGHGPRWSPTGDRLLYLDRAVDDWFDEYTGLPWVANADGSGARPLGADLLTVGVAWSPDGTHIVAREATGIGLRIVRIADARSVRLRFRDPAAGLPSEHDGSIDYYQPDWR